MTIINYHTKNDYTKYPRMHIHTTIKKTSYKGWQKLSIDIDQPTSKMFDVAIDMILDNEALLNDFLNKVRTYR